MLRAVVLLGLLSGCFPFLIPPATIKLGGGFTGRKHILENGQEGSPGALGIGFDTISVSDAPVHAGFGYQLSAFDTGLYFDAGVMRRIAPKWRVNVAGGGDYVTNDGGGGGVHMIASIEYASLHRKRATKVYDPGDDGTHNQTTTYSAVVGSWSIGPFIEPGFRWMNDIGNHGYISIGVIVRMPMGAGVVDVSGQH